MGGVVRIRRLFTNTSYIGICCKGCVCGFFFLGGGGGDFSVIKGLHYNHFY